MVAKMWGTYTQSKTNDTNGNLVFTPVKSKTSEEHGAATAEEDTPTGATSCNVFFGHLLQAVRRASRRRRRRSGGPASP